MAKKYVHVGSKMMHELRFAQCCQHCAYCVSRSLVDDGDDYACARRSRPKREPRMVFGPGSATYRKKCREAHLWWAQHYVSAGTVCDYFEMSRAAQMIEYEDDYTRQAAKSAK